MIRRQFFSTWSHHRGNLSSKFTLFVLFSFICFQYQSILNSNYRNVTTHTDYSCCPWREKLREKKRAPFYGIGMYFISVILQGWSGKFIFTSLYFMLIIPNLQFCPYSSSIFREISLVSRLISPFEQRPSFLELWHP